MRFTAYAAVTGAFFVCLSTTAGAYQVRCGDDLTCATGETGPFTQSPLADSTGSITVPEVLQEYTLTVAKFDPNVAAAIQGTTPDKIHLKRAEVTLILQVEDFSLSVQNIDTTSGCNFSLTYAIDATVLANAGLGTPQIGAQVDLSVQPAVSLEAFDGTPGGADALERTLADYRQEDNYSEVCTVIDSNLAAWIGSGDAQWTLQAFGVNVPQGCPQSFQAVSSHVRADVTVDYFYCVEDSDCPPEGCMPLYWKDNPLRWDGAGSDDFTYSIQHQLTFNSVMNVTAGESGKGDSQTLMQAVNRNGLGLSGLGRHAAAALACADSAINYPFDVSAVIALYRDAVGAAAGPETVDSVLDLFRDANEENCPLGNDYNGSEICFYCYGTEQDCPCGADFASGGCKNSTGQGGTLTASGSTSYAADDLVFTVSNLPSNTPVIWIQATAPTRDPLRDGLLCLAPGHTKILRITNTSSDGSGVSILGPGIIQMSIIHPIPIMEIFPGSIWYFQAYYRDNGSPCGGNANLTNAARVTFF